MSMNPDELKARLMAAAEPTHFDDQPENPNNSDNVIWNAGREAEHARLKPLIEALIDIVIEQQAALTRICDRGRPCLTCDLGYEDAYCSCFDEMDERDESILTGKEALTATRERLQKWVGE